LTDVKALVKHVTADVRPLRHGDFRRLWLGQGVSSIGLAVTTVAVSVQVYDITHSSLWVGLLGPVGLVPLIVFGLWGGAVADAMDRRRLLIVASLVAWSATLGMLAGAIAHLHSVALIMALVALQSIGYAVTSPTRGAIIPRLLPLDLVAAGNTLNFTATTVATLGGPLLAGAVAGHGDFAVAYGIDAVLFTAGLYAAIRLPAIPPQISDKVGSHAGLRSVVDGLRFLTTRPVLLMSFVCDIIAMGVAMPRALFPQVAVASFGGENAVGWLYSAIAAGSVLGGLMSGWIGRVRRQGVALVAAVAVWGAAVAASGLAHRLWLAAVLLAVGGGADLVSSVFRQTILQTYAPDEMRGRLQGVFTVVVTGGPRLGDLRAGTTATLVGVRAAWTGGGVACVAGVLAVLALTPSLRRYDAHSGRPAETLVRGGEPLAEGGRNA
jgi:MFS family permease